MKDDTLNRLHVKRGSELPQSKLTEADVALIQALVQERRKALELAKSLSNARIAEKFGVHPRTIDRISAGESWGHVCQ